MMSEVPLSILDCVRDSWVYIKSNVSTVVDIFRREEGNILVFSIINRVGHIRRSRVVLGIKDINE
mgnify:CR=1 FL=1